MFDKENIDCIIKELKELQSLADALAVCKPVPSSLLQLIKEKALRVATEADQVLSTQEQLITEKQSFSVEPESSLLNNSIGNLASEQSIKNQAEECKTPEDSEESVPTTSDIKPVVDTPVIEPGRGRNVGLTHSLTLNERFRFMKNLFGGNETLMISTLEDLSRFTKMEEMQQYLTVHFQWDWESEPVLDFIQFLEKKIN